MIKIVVDSGSTKSDWLIFEDQNFVKSFQTLGLNPEVITKQELEKRLVEASDLLQKYHSISVYFYGSGCGSPRSKKMVEDAIHKVFTFHTIDYLEVKEDTYAAVYATCHDLKPGIVCINGTGSNCSFFDGKEVHQAVESLGYMAMDDFAGISLGRQLIRAYYFKTLPEHLREELASEYNMSADFIKESFYKKENPNAYLASFLPFIIAHKDEPFLQQMIADEIEFFINHYIKQFEESATNPIHFIGSTAFLLREHVIFLLKKHQLTPGKFYQKPMDGLKEYFTQNV